MLIVERQQRVLELLKQRGSAQLEDIARELDVSTSTVRRDLTLLESRGLVDRTHGGAVYRGDTNVERVPVINPHAPLADRMNEHVAEKQAIARAAANLVKPHMTVLLDGGSTVIFAAREIKARPIQVVTNSLAIANLFADDDQVEILLIGGNLYPRIGVLVGPVATGCLADLHADLLLFSLAGIFDEAAFNINMTMAEVEQVMLQQAARSVMLMDSSKFGRKSLVRVCSLNEVNQIITDDGVNDEWRSRLGSQLHVAE